MRRWAARAYTFIFALHGASIFISIPAENALKKVTWVLWALGASFTSLSVAYGFFGFAAKDANSDSDSEMQIKDDQSAC